jgi:metal-responsive CopG/Arc/MetJ family transcriptional regulator
VARIHLVLPDRLLGKIDRIVGKRERSRFIAQAVQERLERLEMTEALEKSAGTLDVELHPHWKDRKTTSEWVRSVRREG